MRILLADDHPLFAEALQTLLERRAGFEVIGTESTIAGMLAHVARDAPDRLEDLAIDPIALRVDPCVRGQHEPAVGFQHDIEFADDADHAQRNIEERDGRAQDSHRGADATAKSR